MEAAQGSGDADQIRAFHTDDAVMMPFGHILSKLGYHPMPEYWDVSGPDMDREAARHEGGTFEGGVFGVRGSGSVITESRDGSGFSEIALAGSGKVRVDVDGTESLIIEAEDNIMPLLTSEVNGGRLELGASSSISPTTDIIYTVGAIALEGVAVSGSGQVTAAGVAADSFDVEISGSGRVEVTGTSDTLVVAISGSGRYLGEDLEASVGTVRVSGSGEAVVNVTDELDVDVSGSGDVQYIGEPAITESISGSGDITRK